MPPTASSRSSAARTPDNATARIRRRGAIAIGISLAIAATGAAPLASAAVEPADYWAGINQDGHARNASDKPLSGAPRVRWARALRNFALYTNNLHATQHLGQRSNGLAIRDGRILLAVPSTDPRADLSPAHYASFGQFALSDGRPISAVLTPHQGGGAMHARAGLMDSDLSYGLINHYWSANGAVYSAHGSDMHFSTYFDPASGSVPVHLPFAALTGQSNSSGWFAMTNANPLLYATGGTSSHDSWTHGMGGIMGAGRTELSTLKMYNSYLVEGSFVYPYVPHVRGTAGWGGTRISGVEFTASPYSAATRWTYADPTMSFLTFGVNHCGGAPRAFCHAADGRIYFYGYRTKVEGTAIVADWAQGTFLTGVRTLAPNAGTSDITVATGFDPDAESTLSAASLRTELFPQIATRGSHVVVFQPQQRLGVQGRLFCFDVSSTPGRLLWRHDFGAGYFQRQTAFSYSALASPEQAVQLVIAGDKAYVAEPRVDGGVLKLRVIARPLAGGAATVTTLDVLDQAGQAIAVAEPVDIAMRELAAVDGTLVALIDYGRASQALVVVAGDANPVRDFPPVAVIAGPITGAPMHRGYADVPAPSSRFDTGTPIRFSSAGSIDPDGGAITGYLWNFGDGTTSTAAEPVHTYASVQGSPVPIARTVTLTVTDGEGNRSAAATRVLAIRDVGAAVGTVLAAEADAYVDLTATEAAKNFGTAWSLVTGNRYAYYARPAGPMRSYLRFDLQGIDATRVVSAVLRLHSDPNWALSGQHLLARSAADAWNETTITGANAPAPGDVVGTHTFGGGTGDLGYVRGRGAFPHWIDVPVTAYVRSAGSGKVSFALEMALVYPTSSGANYYMFYPKSRESGQAPQLLLLTGDPGYPAPQISPQPQHATATAAAPSAPFSIGATSPAGEQTLRYSWAVVSGPGTLSFSPNHTNAAKATVATAAPAADGTYRLRCVVTDGTRSTASETVTLTIGATGPNTPPSIADIAAQTVPEDTATGAIPCTIGDAQTPGSLTLAAASSNPALVPVAHVAFGGSGTSRTITVQPAANAAGTATITVTVRDASGATASDAFLVTVTAVNDAPTVQTPAAASPAPATGTTVALSVRGADVDDAETTLAYTWSITTKPVGAADPAFSVNGTNAARSTVATLRQAGAYVFAVAIRDPGGRTETSSIAVTVQQTAGTLGVSPATALLAIGETRTFTANANDQFGHAMAAAPTWTVSGGGAIDAGGRFTATAAGGPFTVTATQQGRSATATATVIGTPGPAPASEAVAVASESQSGCGLGAALAAIPLLLAWRRRRC